MSEMSSRKTRILSEVEAAMATSQVIDARGIPAPLSATG
jgi:hypothetical protein